MNNVLVILVIGDIQYDYDSYTMEELLEQGQKKFFLFPHTFDRIKAIREITGQYYYKKSKSLNRVFICKLYERTNSHDLKPEELILSDIYNGVYEEYEVILPLTGKVINEVYEANIVIFLNTRID